MGKVNLCIFDMDGLLIDSEKQMWQNSEDIAYREFNYPQDLKYIRSCMGLNLVAWRKKVLEDLGDDFPFDNFVARVLELNKKAVDEGKIVLMPGVIETLEYLKKNNIECRVATSTYKNDAMRFLDGLGLTKYFTQIITGDMITHSKPDPEIFLKALGDKSKEETLIFEDSRFGLYAGHAAGIRVVLVPDVLEPTQFELDQAFKVIFPLNKCIPIIEELNK